MFGGKKNKIAGEWLEYFTVYDSKSKSYRDAFPAPNKDVVLRDFSNAFRDPSAQEKNMYYRNAEDYSIFKVGEFNVLTGEMQGAQLEHVVNLHDIRAMCQPSSSPGALSAT